MQQELQQSFESLKKAMHSTIKAISLTVEMRDPYTSGHQQRVANLAKAIAEELKLPESQVESIYMAAAIHDIGKISLPAEILVKPIPLTNIEVSLVVQPTDTLYLAHRDLSYYLYMIQNILLSSFFKPIFRYRLRKGDSKTRRFLATGP